MKWDMLLNPELRMWRQEDQEFKVILNYKASVRSQENHKAQPWLPHSCF